MVKPSEQIKALGMQWERWKNLALQSEYL